MEENSFMAHWNKNDGVDHLEEVLVEAHVELSVVVVAKVQLLPLPRTYQLPSRVSALKTVHLLIDICLYHMHLFIHLYI